MVDGPDVDPGRDARVHALMTAELAMLSAPELVDEVLQRLRDLLAVDTAVVLVLEPSGSHLVAFASRGLEDEVLQGFHVSVGTGFAGRVASTRAPVVIDDIQPGSVVNPLIMSRGLRSIAGVPMVALDSLVGVLHVGSVRPRHFDDDDIAVVQAAADRMAAALYAEQLTAERAAARTLQRSLLPGDLPRVDGLELASRFVAAERFGVGGDWIDAFHLPDGKLGVVLGDVTGSGLLAAVVMGRLRSSLRAYAIESSTPGEALRRLNRKFMHFEPGQMATVLYVTIDADRETMTVASAGHPPPVMALPGASARFVEVDPHPPIGVERIRDQPDARVPLPVGATVAAYTDGLFERRDAPIDRQLERLRMSVFPAPAEAVCSSVMAEMIGTHQVEDDTALLVLRRTA